MLARIRVRLWQQKLDQKLVQVLTDISPNTLRVCSRNYHVRTIRTKKLKLFDTVAQEQD
jgi:hypothetical protein